MASSDDSTVEIERKFLVTCEDWRSLLGGDLPVEVKQGYLPTSAPCTLRVRLMGPRAFFTCKTRRVGISRREFEHEMPVEHARFIIDSLCTGGVVEKDRYRVSFAGKIWEVDVFRGRHVGLVLAEVELVSENEVVELPDWVGQEVSSDPQYTNQALARVGTDPASGA